MSLIADALKTAQREKERRASHEGPSAASILLPLREPRRRVSPKRLVMLVGVAVVVGAAAIIVRGVGRAERLPPAPVVASTMLSEAIAADSSRVARTSAPARPATSAVTTTRPRVSRVAGPAAVQAGPSLDTIVVSQSDASRQAGVVSQAGAGELRVAVETRPNADRLFNEAVASHRSGDIERARLLYQRVLGLHADHSDALNNFAVILSGEREFDRALELLHRAALLAPRSAGTWNNIGTALREQGKGTEAISAFRRALEIDPQHLGARVGLAQQYFAIGALPESRQLLEQVLASNPTLAEAHYTLGQVLQRQGDRAGSIQAYTMFVTVAPPHLASHAERVRQYLETLSP